MASAYFGHPVHCFLSDGKVNIGPHLNCPCSWQRAMFSVRSRSFFFAPDSVQTIQDFPVGSLFTSKTCWCFYYQPEIATPRLWGLGTLMATSFCRSNPPITTFCHQPSPSHTLQCSNHGREKQLFLCVGTSHSPVWVKPLQTSFLS